LAKRKFMPDGCIRILMDNGVEEQGSDGGTTIEYWSGSRRVLYTPCSPRDLYIALTMLDSDVAAKTTPIRQQDWTRSFPHLADLFARIGERGRYDRFECIKLKRWSSGRVAVIGDAAHALPPNIGQGAGCGMMNGLSLAVHLERHDDIPSALARWEHNERPITDHTQRISVFLGLPTTWPAPLRSLFFSLAGRSRWLIEQRTRTARHRPTGTMGDQPIAT
jgi:2-polyprenyl-6-methoxyphenol hydroxylase-like FAD-dependent oxidoreductase